MKGSEWSETRDDFMQIPIMFNDIAAGFSLEIYFQMVHNSIGRYEPDSLHTAIEMLSGKPGYIVSAVGRV